MTLGEFKKQWVKIHKYLQKQFSKNQKNKKKYPLVRFKKEIDGTITCSSDNINKHTQEQINEFSKFICHNFMVAKVLHNWNDVEKYEKAFVTLHNIQINITNDQNLHFNDLSSMCFNKETT